MGTGHDPGPPGLRDPGPPGLRDPGPPGLRELPAVHELAATLDAPHALAVAAARRAIEERREALLAGAAGEATDVSVRARELLDQLSRPSLRRVLNATGVIVHTNLGRAPLSAAARDAVARAAEGYSNLELALDTGTRGSRHAHVSGLLCELTGAQDAIVVNNGAGAVLLAAAALAGGGGTIVVSRGQLVEIGGGFRIPEVIEQSGASLLEVGTTNRTGLRDYEAALATTPDAVILRVHPSNFRAVGFVEEVAIEALCGLGAPVIDDVGSGVLARGIPALADEPLLERSIEAGAALVCCSADKLLGGPQGGLLIGREEAVAAARKHPLARALRIDKLSLAALQGTLMLYRDPGRARREIPVLAMLDCSDAVLQRRVERLRAGIGAGEIVEAVARVGGGALPLLELTGPALALGGSAPSPTAPSPTAPSPTAPSPTAPSPTAPSPATPSPTAPPPATPSPATPPPAALAQALRAGEPPVIGRIHDGRLLLDPRTLADEEIAPAAAAVRRALDCLRSP